MATFEFIPIPIGSQFVKAIAAGDPPDTNDFKVLLVANENVTGLRQRHINVSTGGTVMSLTGQHAVYEVTIRPPTTPTVLTLTLAANAVTEGNTLTTKTVRITNFFPDADAEAPTQLFTHNLSHSYWRGYGANGRGITLSPSRLILSSSGQTNANYRKAYLDFFTHAGVHQSAETIAYTPRGGAFTPRGLDYVNGDLLYAQGDQTFWSASRAWGRYNLETEEFAFDYEQIRPIIAHTPAGILTFPNVTEPTIRVFPYPRGTTGVDRTVSAALRTIDGAASQEDLLYVLSASSYGVSQPGSGWHILEVTADGQFTALAPLNIATRTAQFNDYRDVAIYRDTLYMLDSTRVLTLDIKKYRPIARRTKTTIPPVFATPGDTIDLKQFVPDAERIVFDVGYNKPAFLSISASGGLTLTASAETCLVKLKAINRVDATATGSLEFYLVVLTAAAPVWRDLSALTMRAGSTYDVSQLVENATAITVRSGTTLPAGATFSGGTLTIGTTGGTVALTATNTTGSTHIAFTVHVVQPAFSPGDGVSYRVLIENVEVTADLLSVPTVSETLDPILLNVYRVNTAQVTLRNESGKYSGDRADNFWDRHSFNPGGFQNTVSIRLVDSSGNEHLLFAGIINESTRTDRDGTFRLNCVDISAALRTAEITNFGPLEKWAHLRRASDEVAFVGRYMAENSLLPMQIGTGVARSDRTDLTISRLELPSEGPALRNTGHITATDLQTSGGFLDENPILRFKSVPRSEDVRFLINQLAINKNIYNTEIEIPGVVVHEPFLLNRGSPAFSVEATRPTRLPTDWVDDPTHNRILMLLSNPEGHIADLLVAYHLETDMFEVLYTFAKTVAVHRIARRDSGHYYLLTSAKIAQDRSAATPPRQDDGTAFTFTSAATGSQIRIYHYNAGTNTLTQHIAESDNYPPQLGSHLWAGFENSLYTDTFEGIRNDYRGAFKWVSNALFYRYAKHGEFGVAQVTAGGTTSRVMQATKTAPMKTARILDSGNRRLFTVAADTANNATAQVISSVTLPSTLASPEGIVVDGSDLYIVSRSQRRVGVVPANTTTGATTRLFYLPSSISSPYGMALSGDDLFIVNGSGVHVLSKNTANGTTATVTRRFNLPSGLSNPQGAVADGNDLYIVGDSFSSDDVFVVPANTANNTTPTTANTRRFSLPSGIATPRGLSIDGDDLYIIDYNTNDVHIVPKNTGNGATATLTRSFALSSSFALLGGITVVEMSVQTSPFRQEAMGGTLNYAFDVTATGEIYLVHALQLRETSTLIIKRRASGGTETTVLSETRSLDELTDLDTRGGAYLGCSECLFHNNFLYLLVPIQRVDVDPTTSAKSRSVTKASGLVLYRCNVTASTPALTVIATWDFASRGACNLTIYDNAVHFVESPSTMETVKPINPDLDGYWTDAAKTQTQGYNLLPAPLGALKKVTAAGTVESLGNVWWTDRPFNEALTRCLAIGEDLHLLMGYGNIEALGRFNALANGADAGSHIIYGKTLHYVVPSFTPSGPIYNALESLAKRVNATLSFENNVIRIADRRPSRALTDGATGTGAGTLAFKDANKTFPDSGYVLIGKEVLRYTGITGGNLTGITRGVSGSAIADHADASDILYLDTLMQGQSKSVTLQSDTSRIFNIVRDSGGVVEVRDAASIARYGERPYILDLGLTRHERVWIEEIFKSYLRELKDLQQVVNIQIVPDFALRLGQIVPFFYQDQVMGLRIVSIRYEQETTHIVGRTI